MATQPSPCVILGVVPGSSQEVVRAAYKKRILEAHPDKGGDAEQFRQIREAYEKLKNLVSVPNGTVPGAPVSAAAEKQSFRTSKAATAPTPSAKPPGQVPKYAQNKIPVPAHPSKRRKKTVNEEINFAFNNIDKAAAEASRTAAPAAAAAASRAAPHVARSGSNISQASTKSTTSLSHIDVGNGGKLASIAVLWETLTKLSAKKREKAINALSKPIKVELRAYLAERVRAKKTTESTDGPASTPLSKAEGSSRTLKALRKDQKANTRNGTTFDFLQGLRTQQKGPASGSTPLSGPEALDVEAETSSSSASSSCEGSSSSASNDDSDSSSSTDASEDEGLTKSSTGNQAPAAAMASAEAAAAGAAAAATAVPHAPVTAPRPAATSTATPQTPLNTVGVKAGQKAAAQPLLAAAKSATTGTVTSGDIAELAVKICKTPRDGRRAMLASLPTATREALEKHLQRKHAERLKKD